MYATREGSPVYHLIDTRTGRTVCGLYFHRISVKKKPVLSHTPTKPLDKTICKNCVEMTDPNP
jgi:hypothetical protein